MASAPFDLVLGLRSLRRRGPSNIARTLTANLAFVPPRSPYRRAWGRQAKCGGLEDVILAPGPGGNAAVTSDTNSRANDTERCSARR